MARGEQSVNRFRTAGALALSGALIAAGCSDSGDSRPTVTDPPSVTTSTEPPITAVPLATDDALAAELDAVAVAGCDMLDPRACLLPYPSDFFTTTDPATDTGLRVAFPAGGTPVNVGGAAIDPAEWNRNDGFSPNSSILTFVAGLDPVASKLPSWTDIGASLEPDSPIVIIDASTGERIPLWAELDVKAASDDDRLLVIQPAVVLGEGRRYVVALRNLTTASGPALPGPAFRAYRDRVAGPDWLEARRSAMESNFEVLAAEGIVRDDLFLAWDFTVASTRSLAERMIGIRDEALGTVGDSPTVIVSEVLPPTDADGLIARQVRGIVEVPNFLTNDGSPGNGFFYGADGLTSPDEIPTQNGTLLAPFACNIPTVAVDGSATGPTHLALYGHGLLGSNLEIDAGNVRAMANEHNVIFCATKWAGMSEDDIPNAIAALQDLTRFSTVADRLQQGVLNAIVLGRAMTSATGITADAAFDDAEVDLEHLDYDGNSQGGIMGLVLAAVSPDIDRAVLGVPGMNYSLLLPRSVDFDDYEAVFAPAYPNDLDRTLILSMLQMLWDRGEGAGYVRHVTSDPYPGTSSKDVLLHVALGDHQVSQLAALIEARALGARYHEPFAAPGRLRSESVTFGLEPIPSYPYAGSAIVLWDSGAAEIPLERLAPRDGNDPHEDPRRAASARTQKAAFLFEDRLIDVCDGGACVIPPT